MVEKVLQNSNMHISSLIRYPVKGMSAQKLNQVEVKAGNCFPYDRAFAIENGPNRFDPKDPKHLPKINFLNLMRDERLALLNAEFDEETNTLTILREGRQLAKGNLKTSIGRNMIEQFLAAFMQQELKGPPRILNAENHHFTDIAENQIHIINLQSVTALENMMNQKIDPARFRANLHISGAEPWSEKQWLGKTLRSGDVEIRIMSETSRCAAVNVDLTTAKRGPSIPASLSQHFNNNNFGVYGEIIKSGNLAVNDPITLIESIS